MEPEFKKISKEFKVEKIALPIKIEPVDSQYNVSNLAMKTKPLFLNNN